ncbi:MAG TPA: signal peptidase I [Patescibacteria group bacterium]|nr:signal peptidase I [Patescibacteria group bacterium]
MEKEVGKEALKKGEKKFWKSTKKVFGKFWNLLWKDNSIKGWLFSIIFLFIFIKFIFFPLLNLATGTALPLAIVESCSMYHQGNLFSDFNNWWDQHLVKYSGLGIHKEDFQNFIFRNGLNKGDILFTVGVKPENLRVGDVIIFNADQQNPIIHRIIKIQKTGDQYIFSTIGDNNNAQLPFETSINQNQIVGKPIAKIAPYLGWVKLIFFEGSKPPSERGLCTQTPT